MARGRFVSPSNHVPVADLERQRVGYGRDHERAPLSGAERQRRRRQRKAEGARIVRIDVSPDVIDYLIARRLLDLGRADDADAVAQAMENLLDLIAAGEFFRHVVTGGRAPDGE